MLHPCRDDKKSAPPCPTPGYACRQMAYKYLVNPLSYNYSFTQLKKYFCQQKNPKKGHNALKSVTREEFLGETKGGLSGGE
jgi:hypothetical protein